jgi:hypothetical protein
MNAFIAEKARLAAASYAERAPLTREDKTAILKRLAELPAIWKAQDPKAWAFRLRDREMSGEKLRESQRKMWRTALSTMGAEE